MPTARQLEYADAVEKHGSVYAAAKALGVHKKTVRVAVRKTGAQRGVPHLSACSTGPAACAPATVRESGLIARRILVLPDVHVPYHDQAAWNLAVRAVRVLQPDLLVVIGDFVDCYSVSQFSKDPRRKQNLQWELDAANEELDKLRDTAGSYLYTVGNHEHRIERYIHQRAPELDGMISLQEYLKAKERGFQWVPYKDFVKVGKVAFTHEIGHAGKMAATHSLAAFGGNLVIGHTHRAATIYSGTVDEERHFCLNVGWLGDPKQVDYVHRSQMRDWQHASAGSTRTATATAGRSSARSLVGGLL